MDSGLSKYFSWAEAKVSDYAERNGIDNSIPQDIAATIWAVTAPKLDIVREKLKAIIHVNSWYRCNVLNKAIGGSITSQHRLGLAVDFICPEFGTPYQIVKFLQDCMEELSIDQLIWEHTWVHISFTIPTVKPRMEVLTYQKSPSGVAIYTKGLPENESTVA